MRDLSSPADQLLNRSRAIDEAVTRAERLPFNNLRDAVRDLMTDCSEAYPDGPAYLKKLDRFEAQIGEAIQTYRKKQATHSPAERTDKQWIESGESVGLSVGIAKGDERWLAKGYGLANLKVQAPAASKNVYRIGSITKQFTAVAILLLVKMANCLSTIR